MLDTERQKLSTSFACGNEDRDAYSTTCKLFEANSRLFEFAVVDCHTQLNFLEYQAKWYPALYNKSNAVSGLSLFTWEKVIEVKKLNYYKKNELYKLPVSHDSDGYTDVNTYNLYLNYWDPYKKQYSVKKLAGRLMIIIKQCRAPENDKMTNPISLKFGTDCYENNYILNNTTTCPTSHVDCSNYKLREDVWYKTMVPEQVGIYVEVKRVDGNIADPMIEAYVKSGFGMICVNATTSSKLELTDLQPGEELYFRVFNESDTDRGSFYISMSQTSLSNNTCGTAVELTVGNSCDRSIYHNYGATASGYSSNKAIYGRTDRALDIWLTLEVPSSGNLLVESFEVEDGVTEVIIEAYSSSCGNLKTIGM